MGEEGSSSGNNKSNSLFCSIMDLLLLLSCRSSISTPDFPRYLTPREIRKVKEEHQSCVASTSRHRKKKSRVVS
jgi:hypothetical protein